MPNLGTRRNIIRPFVEPVVAGGAPFDPTSLSNAVWGIDTELTTISGPDVSSVTDEIGSRDLQQLLTFGLPDTVSAFGVDVLDFDDSVPEAIGFAGAASDSITDFSIFTLINIDSTSVNAGNIMAWGDDTTETAIDSRAPGWIGITKVQGSPDLDLRGDLDGDSNQNLRTDNVTSAWHIIELRITAAGGAAGVADFWIDGVEDANGVTGQSIAALDLQSCIIGARRVDTTPDNPTDFDLAAIWIIENPSADDIDKMEGYLGWWGNQTGGLLPGGHTYKSSPPTT